MSILIFNPSIKSNESSRFLTGLDSAVTFTMYKLYHDMFGITANHIWDRYTYIDEENNYIGTFRTFDKMCEKINIVMDEVHIMQTEVWLDNTEPGWRTEPRYQYW